MHYETKRKKHMNFDLIFKEVATKLKDEQSTKITPHPNNNVNR